MSNERELVILNRSFRRVYRSFTQYLTEAWPKVDAGDAEELRNIVLEEGRLAEKLGRYLVEQQGYADTSQFPKDYQSFHYVTVTRLLPEWLAHQRSIVEDLEKVRQEIGDSSSEGVAILDEIREHERVSLEKLVALEQKLASG